MENKKYQISSKIYLFIMIILVISSVILLYWRCVRGVEMTDEIHGIASMLHILQGKKPFMTSWDVHPGWCLQVFLFGIYYKIKGTEGIVFFSRLIYVSLSFFLISILIVFLNRKLEYKKGGFYFELLLLFTTITHVAGSGFQFNYNNISAYGLLTVSFLMIESKGKRRNIFYFLLGIIMGCLCINYPYMIFIAVLLTIYIWAENVKDGVITKILLYAGGGVVVALCFMGWIFRGGSWNLFFTALKEILNSPHETIKGNIDIRFVYKVFIIPLRDVLRYQYLLLIYILVQCTESVLSRRTHRRFSLHLVIFCVYVATIAIHYNIADQYAFSVKLFIASLVWICVDKGLELKKYALYFEFAFAFCILYGFASDNKNVLIGVHITTLIIVFATSRAIIDRLRTEKDFVRAFVSITMFIVLAFPGIKGCFEYVYGDEPVKLLTTKVESGVYRGLYTTEKRAEFVVEFERELREHVDERKSICVVTKEPMIYVMSEARICTPLTWDPQFLNRGFTSAAPVLDYFEAIHETPDIIAATTSSIADFYENDKYEINGFIKENYDIYYDKDIKGTILYLWKRK